MKELEKTYDPKLVEDRIYKLWTDGGFFKGVADPGKKPFTIVIPPPNVTGQLHLGHAFNNTLQDILIRFKRMQGYAALWLPGTDHAGIATQIRVEEDLRSEGLTRHDLGRDRFLERVWEWKRTYGSRIVEQLKKLGSSCDWSRERFTMDDGCSKAVREVFVSLYEKGLIYKGNRIINWCPKCTTALSDAEVEHEERTSFLWYIKYPVKGSSEHVIVATTRPETMLGDTGVAVHPDDKRYRHLIGGTVLLPLTDREIPVVADEFVDLEFGTGCVKVTPCHDPNDFEIGQRHGLAQVLMLDGEAKVINSGKYNGLDRYDARREVVSDLDSLGLLHKTQEHTNNVGMCHRCGTTVEPITSEQWFVKMAPLAKDAIEVVENGRIKYVPERFAKIYTHWMENVRDWCISRQLWWGHRIPAWYCRSCTHLTVSRDDPDLCEKCGSSHIKQDEDVLDTWFSSALWPFSTLGWPDDTEDMRYFYPTDVLVTGYDIIFFWVARMIFSGMEYTGKAPFHTVFINGIIRDAEGRKMSKSLGNGIDPIDMIEKYGADALRFNIITGNSPGNDIRFYPERCEAMRNFANKIWNASRFVMMNLRSGEFEGAALSGKVRVESGEFGDGGAEISSQCTINNAQLGGGGFGGRLPGWLELEDKWILSKLNTLAGEVCENMDKFELGVAASKIYDFIWDVYCDWYIELTKPRLQAAQRTGKGELKCSGESGDDSLSGEVGAASLSGERRVESGALGDDSLSGEVGAASLSGELSVESGEFRGDLSDRELKAEGGGSAGDGPQPTMHNAQCSFPYSYSEGSSANNALKVLLYVLEEVLALLHPFMPFITEEIWQALPRRAAAYNAQGTKSNSQRTNHSGKSGNVNTSATSGSFDIALTDNPSAETNYNGITPPLSTFNPQLPALALMLRSYPRFNESLSFPKEESEFESIMAAIRAIRARRAEMNVPPSKKPPLTIVTDKTDVFKAGCAYIGRLAYAGELTITNETPEDLSGLVTVVTNDARMFIPLAELVDLDKERERVNKEIAKAKAIIEQTERKLSNSQFTEKAPEHVVNAEREKLVKAQALLDNLTKNF